ncbi:MAG: hypothetical protein FJ031_00255 [Chloroflexi bacterium]|nr:hypothetical protein [Chloroflexota bacterium]
MRHYIESEKRADADARDRYDELRLLIGDDISGIQKFIYTITSKKAAQTLRGRSFYLQLLTEVVMGFVLADYAIVSHRMRRQAERGRA